MKLCNRLLLLAMLVVIPRVLHANDLQAKHVALHEGVAGSYALVEFDLSWENSWRNDLNGAGQAAPYNFDAAWVFVKFSTDGGTTWEHASLSANSSDHGVSNDNGVPAKLRAASDRKGVFIFRANNGAGTNAWQGVQLRWIYSKDGLASISSAVVAKVIGIEMVFIPSGNFFVGDLSAHPVNGQFEDGDSGKPFEITCEDEIKLGGGKKGSLGNHDAKGMASEDDFDGHDREELPDDFPKGHAAFYAMKYEITQGQYADFLNTLTSAQAARRALSGSGDYSAFRGTISGGYPVYATSAPERACNFTSWMDGAAYADWAGLRPMTELEFEKTGRGDQSVVSGEFAWGNTSITSQTGHNGTDGSGSETASPATANANFDSGINGPVRAGIYAAASGGDRAQAGASYYGVMELSGNVFERVVTVGNSAGRKFDGTHGDGRLSTKPGFEGNATNKDWPGIDSQSSRGVTGAKGAGLRGGGWKDAAALLRLADRTYAATTDDQRANHYGFRCVRTAW